MTIKQFVKQLKQRRGEFVWGLVPDTGWAADRRAWTRYRIRAQSEDEAAGAEVFDPIGALCYAQTGKVFAEDDWPKAARKLGLSKADAEKLTAAANDRTWIGPEGHRRPVKDLQELRVLLIEAVEEAEVGGRVGR